MNAREIFMFIAVIVSLYMTFSSISVINNYQTERSLEPGQRLRLYYISILIPLLGFILTRRLKKELNSL